MMKPVKFLLAGACLSAASTHAADLYLGVDVSVSNPVMASSAYAEAIANRAEKKVRSMTYGDRIYLGTLGNGHADHVKTKSLQITRKMPPQRAASLIANEIKSFHSKGEGENSTHLLAFLEDSNFDCEQDDSSIWLLTDGIEHSVDFDGSKLLKGKPLPDPYEKTLMGCEVVMIGIGRLADGGRYHRKQVQNLKKAWSDWLKKAGAKSVTLSVNP